MNTYRTLATAMGLTLAMCSVVSAQSRPNTREGFWVGFGVGGGSAGADCSFCGTDRTSGPSGYIRLGGTVSPSLLIGGETNGWRHSENGVDQTMGFAAAVLLWYPSRTGALYLKFGLGGMRYTATNGPDKIEATAGAASLGIGYDIRVGRMVSVTPFLNSLASSPARFTFNGQTAPTNQDIKLNVVQAGLGITWH